MAACCVSGCSINLNLQKCQYCIASMKLISYFLFDAVSADNLNTSTAAAHGSLNEFKVEDGDVAEEYGGVVGGGSSCA